MSQELRHIILLMSRLEFLFSLQSVLTDDCYLHFSFPSTVSALLMCSKKTYPHREQHTISICASHMKQNSSSVGYVLHCLLHPRSQSVFELYTR